MFKRLFIRNYAIIPELDLTFQDGLSIITGETGAGKSILLGALGLALGKRADTKVLPDDSQRCIVEATFELPDDTLAPTFEREELEFDRQLILRREIHSGGRSRSFINDTPVSLKLLQDIAAELIELHHQSDHLALQSRDYQLQVVDNISHASALLREYKTKYQEWLASKNQLAVAIENEKSSIRRKDFLQFQLDELQQAKLSPGEMGKLEESQNVLEHAEAIDHVIQQLQSGLQKGQHSILYQLSILLKAVNSVSAFFPALADLKKRLESLSIEVQDLALEAERMEGPGGSDPHKLIKVQGRLSQLYSLIKKYQCKDETQLISLYEELKTEWSSLSSINELIVSLELTIEQLKNELVAIGMKLRTKRKSGAKKIIPAITDLLRELGMPNAKMDIEIIEAPEPTATGLDEILFTFSANKGMSLQPLHTVASGGELSRLSLAIKSILAWEAALPTIIFDEIDTGISGEVAWRMGQLILGMAKGHQILMITHSPQIAAHAQHQFHVTKNTVGLKDISSIYQLDAQQRINEIAKMLSGDPPSKAAINNAASLIKSVKKK